MSGSGEITITLDRWRNNRRLVAQRVLIERDASEIGNTLKEMQRALDEEEKVPYTFSKSSVPDSVREKLKS